MCMYICSPEYETHFSTGRKISCAINDGHSLTEPRIRQNAGYMTPLLHTGVRAVR